MLVWAAPAQVILISALGTGAALFEVAIAVTLSAIRLFPMVVALLPLLRGPGTRLRDLLLPTHFTSVSMWVESLRLLPALPHERRIAFCNGLSVGYMGTAVVFGFVGFYLAAGLPPLFAGTLLFLTPMSFLISTARNARMMVDRLALVLGLVLGPLLTVMHVDLDLMWTGVGRRHGSPMPSIACARPRHERRADRAVALSGADPGRLSAERDLARARPGAGARAQ